MPNDINQITHKLRGALHVFNSFVRYTREYLDGGSKPLNKEDLRKYCNIAQEKVKKVLALIDDLELTK